MAVQPYAIAGELGTQNDPLVQQSYQQWITDARLLIEIRAKKFGKTLAQLDQRILDYVVRKVVVAYARNPSGLTQTSESVSVDDGSYTTAGTFRYGRGDLYVPADYWEMLGLVEVGGRRAFTLDTIPDQGSEHTLSCALRLGATYCDCGAAVGGGLAIWTNGEPTYPYSGVHTPAVPTEPSTPVVDPSTWPPPTVTTGVTVSPDKFSLEFLWPWGAIGSVQSEELIQSYTYPDGSIIYRAVQNGDEMTFLVPAVLPPSGLPLPIPPGGTA